MTTRSISIDSMRLIESKRNLIFGIECERKTHTHRERSENEHWYPIANEIPHRKHIRACLCFCMIENSKRQPSMRILFLVSFVGRIIAWKYMATKATILPVAWKFPSPVSDTRWVILFANKCSHFHFIKRHPYYIQIQLSDVCLYSVYAQLSSAQHTPTHILTKMLSHSFLCDQTLSMQNEHQIY